MTTVSMMMMMMMMRMMRMMMMMRMMERRGVDFAHCPRSLARCLSPALVSVFFFVLHFCKNKNFDW